MMAENLVARKFVCSQRLTTIRDEEATPSAGQFSELRSRRHACPMIGILHLRIALGERLHLPASGWLKSLWTIHF
jgi:hypothetical protein